jgi:benzoate 4-monooxygenase
MPFTRYVSPNPSLSISLTCAEIWPPRAHLPDPRLLRYPSSPATIYAHGASALPKAPFYCAFYVGGAPSLFSTQDRAGHAKRRRALAHLFSLACVRAYEAWVQRSLRPLVRALDAQCVSDAHPGTSTGRGLGPGAETLERAGGSQQAKLAEECGFVDLLAWLNYMTFDVISDLAFGAPLGMLARESPR